MISADKMQEIADKVAIQEVLARYSICVDTGDADGFAGLFTEDGVWEWKAVGLRLCGRQAIGDIARAVSTHAKGAQHAISNPVIAVEGNKAKSICQLTCFLSRPEQIYSLMLGYYEDEWLKVDDSWLISRRAVRVENPELLSHGKIAEYFAPLAEAMREMTQASG